MIWWIAVWFGGSVGTFLGWMFLAKWETRAGKSDRT